MVVQDVPTSVRLPIEIDTRLELLAKKTGHSKSHYLREIITAGIERLEWEQMIAERAKAARENLDQLTSLETLAERDGLSREELRAPTTFSDIQ